MTVRVGLRHMQRLVKKPSVCPSGEQITNGGFETGDATGWTLNVGDVQSATKHSGSYAARIYPSGSRELYQTLATPVPVQCVNSFGVWIIAGASNIVNIWVKYSDGSSDTTTLSLSSVWQYVDLKAILTAGKTITQLYILGGSINMTYVDDASLIC